MPVEGAIRDRNGAGFELIETMRWEPQVGFLRGDRHLARLRASAKTLGFSRDPQDALAKAEEIVAGSEVPLRIRLALSRDGTIAAKSEIYEPLPDGAVWWLKPASSPFHMSITRGPIAATSSRPWGVSARVTTRRSAALRSRATKPRSTIWSIRRVSEPASWQILWARSPAVVMPLCSATSVVHCEKVSSSSSNSASIFGRMRLIAIRIRYPTEVFMQ